MNWLKKLYSRPKVKATLERTWRGGVAGIGAALAAGAYTVNDIVNGHHLNDLWTSFAGGCVAALVLSMGISQITGTGPALNDAESIGPEQPPDEGGQIHLGLVEICVLVLTVVATLWWFGVRPG